ncbi:vWA domain-containing protein [Tuwongella immobilis]|uniref:VWFA domain-containing protein n=1 Tax=Tuwongella immobilis TaxID=692036 RepID=A0A6C2YUQ1_9BACT|nr:BatA and WFA domain-containing protein [Tuwongella immobilis]VIP04883.1 von Willebrand factor type A OS=Pirellula staleyi (strain ATCC 27377 / DSM 6068 / ICPB 4128) GN=Psta_2131 PE=4 SV=1: BatA: VWA_2 [Tuwongella immobilis]VTS07125.1 von Willebrand factor type A OS=Pirellula staleyi (strain ATCC 27377 / DSM 6068 / ICPB 4128) GN=Psta_2131 PE=4 SV=1: BatA: VWA_2 [Tuwongella immobilis]
MHWLARTWFPVALVGLLLLALPGMILFGLDLAGYESQANNWLQDHFSLSHHLPLPPWAGALLFLVPVAILILYFLKLKRKPQTVSSTYLWKQSIEDLHVNRLLQWLRRNILLILQLLAILMLLYAILGPRLHGTTLSGGRYILMLDHSASMNARTPDGKSRLEVAQEQALAEIDAASDGDEGMVIVFAGNAEIRQSFTRNRELLRKAVRAIEPTEQVTRLDEALNFAGSLANPLRSTEDEMVKPLNAVAGQERVYVPAEGVSTLVHLFSDGRFPDVPEFSLANLSVRYHPVELTDAADNLAITRLDAFRDEDNPEQVQIEAEVVSFRDVASICVLRIDVRVRGQLQTPRDTRLEVPPRRKGDASSNDPAAQRDQPGERRVSIRVPNLPENAEITIAARLDQANDALPLDDRADVVLGVVRKAQVLIVGPDNPLLHYVFDAKATRAIADVRYLPASTLTDAKSYGEPAASGTWDLIIYDRCAPAREEEMPRANTLFLGEPPPPWKRANLETVEFPQIRGYTDQHPVMRGLRSWLELEIAEAYRMPELPPRAPRLLEGDRGLVLMTALERGSYRDIVLAFPLETADSKWNTRWFLRPLFPLFLWNLLYASGNVRDASSEPNTQPGEVKRLRPGGMQPQMTIEQPDGSTRTLERGNRAEFLVSQTEQQGVYTARIGDQSLQFAVNLFDVEESNLSVRRSFQVGNERVDAGERREQPQELWKWGVLLGLLALVGEWWVYNRRVAI